MINEIYIRDKSDPNFEEGIVDFENDIESTITQIRVLLGTKEGDVLGNNTFGIDIEYLVFDTVKNSIEVQDLVADKIRSYVIPGKNITITTDVKFGDSGHGYDYAIIDIILNGRKALGLLVNKD
jgi:hypothetical protein